jgi:hypothetical protein
MELEGSNVAISGTRIEPAAASEGDDFPSLGILEASIRKLNSNLSAMEAFFEEFGAEFSVTNSNRPL